MDPRRYQAEQQQSQQQSGSQQNSGQAPSRHQFAATRQEAGERGSARDPPRPQFYSEYYDPNTATPYPNIFPGYSNDGRPYPQHAGSMYPHVSATEGHVPHPGVYPRGQHPIPSTAIPNAHYFPLESSYQPAFGHPHMPVPHTMPPTAGQHPPAEMQVDQDPTGAPAKMSAAETQMRLNEFNEAMVHSMRALKAQNFVEFRNAIRKLCTWFKTQVEPLELHLDSMELRDERLQMWRNFNHLYMGGLQLHWDVGNGEVPSERTLKLLTIKDLVDMGNELTSLCNSLEPHGLVDYEYGIWEEQIVSLLLKNMRAMPH